MPEPLSNGWHCINCGSYWGGSTEIFSHGVCIHCLAEWVNNKKREKGLLECFGQYKELLTVDCGSCTVKKYCKEFKETL